MRNPWHILTQNRTTPFGVMAVLLSICIGGCQTTASRPTNYATLEPTQPAIQHPAVVTTATNEPIREAAEEELGIEAAQAIEMKLRPVPQPVEVGAKAIVDSVLNGMGSYARDASHPIRIGIKLRNQSRAAADEFLAFQNRFADELNRAASQQSPALVEFVVTDAGDAACEMHGAAYVISAGGFDLWEVFASVAQVSPRISLWEAPRPIRMLRQARPGQPQIVGW